jgi:hypothetical protein
MRMSLLDKTIAEIWLFGVSIKQVSFRFIELQLQMHQFVQAHRLPNETIAQQFEEGTKAPHLLGRVSQDESVEKLFEDLADGVVAVGCLVQIFELNVELHFYFCWLLRKLCRVKRELERVVIRIGGCWVTCHNVECSN